MSSSLPPHGLQHARPPCPSPTPRVYPNSCPLSRWCHPTISSSVVPFSSRLQSFPASESFPMSQLFASAGRSIGVSASTSILSMNTQDWPPLGWTGCIFLQSKGLKSLLQHHSSKASILWHSILLVIRGLQVKTTMRYYYKMVRMTISKQKTDNTNCWQESRVREHSRSIDGNTKRYSHCERHFGGFSQN